jgi:predicted DNA-binding protein (MmcQ/YjbR family)
VSRRTPVDRLRAICLALPEATEKIAWDEPTWRVRGTIFTDPARFFRPPYVGPRGWVGVRLDRRPSWTKVAAVVERAYRLVAPSRLLESLGTTPQSRKRPLSRKRIRRTR